MTRKTHLLAWPALIALILIAGRFSHEGDAQAANDGAWVEAIRLDGTAGAGNEVATKMFELPHAAKVKIKWDVTPAGNAPLFRATLGSWQEDAQKYVNAGVIVRAGGADAKEQAGKLPAGKHRVMFTMKNMKYSFSIYYQR